MAVPPNLKGTFGHVVRVLRTRNVCDYCVARTILNFEIAAAWFVSDKFRMLGFEKQCTVTFNVCCAVFSRLGRSGVDCVRISVFLARVVMVFEGLRGRN